MFIIKTQLKGQKTVSYVWGNRFTTDPGTASLYVYWIDAFEKIEEIKPFLHLDSKIWISATT